MNQNIKRNAVYPRRFEVVSAVAVLLWALLFGQSAAPAAQATTFHVQGTISTPWDSLDPSVHPPNKITVTFKGDQETRIVPVDNKGFYQTDLPIGTYTMSTEGPEIGPNRISVFTTQVRPLFRVTSPAILTLNGALYMARMTCDAVVRADITLEQQVEQRKDTCGGGDFFSAPSKDGVPFQLYIQYLSRHPADEGYVYSTGRISNEYVPVFVAYNLFSLEADKVIYDVESRILEASGNVIWANGSGAIKRARSTTFKIQNGHATHIR